MILAGAPYTEQAQVSNWPGRIALVVIVLVVVGLSLWGMRAGWKARAGRQSELPEPATAAHNDATWLLVDVPARYVATTVHDDWLDRVVVHDLGTPSRALVSVGSSGLLCAREGARDVFIPTAAIESVRSGRGIAGSVFERDGIVMVTWRLGDALLDSGIRADTTDQHVELLTALGAVVDKTKGVSS